MKLSVRSAAIHTEADYLTVLRVVSALVDLNPEVNSPEGKQLDVLTSLVQEYEAKHYPVDPNKLCFKHGFLPFPCQKCSTEQQEISRGICPECHGEGEQGGQFCGGYWMCEACNGTGKYKDIKI